MPTRLLSLVLGFALLACAPTAPAVQPAGDSGGSAGTSSGRSAMNAPIRYTLVPDGTEARYRSREQLARLSLPSDAVGSTKDVQGTLVLQPDGTIARDQSKWVVDLRSLTSDSDRRDRYLQDNTLETAKFPSAEFVPTGISGLPLPPPTSGPASFDLTGDLTLKGVTKPVTWKVNGEFEGEQFSGQATTSITFTQFQLTKPQVASVLSVEDDIRLELDLRMAGQPAG